jgi:hypothetical protein
VRRGMSQEPVAVTSASLAPRAVALRRVPTAVTSQVRPIGPRLGQD